MQITSIGIYTSSDGYTALALMDANHDNKIDSNDAIWLQLKVWVDKTGSGKFQNGALFTFDQLGITALNLNVTNVQQANNGNVILHDGSFSKTGGGTGDIAGVNLVFDAHATQNSSAKLLAHAEFGASSDIGSDNSAAGDYAGIGLVGLAHAWGADFGM